MRAFHRGELPEVSVEGRRKLTQPEQDVYNKLLWKALCRGCKALAGLCFQDLQGSGVMSRQSLTGAAEHRASALQSE